MKILVINNGSSSLKFAVYNLESEDKLASGLFEGIGTSLGQFSIQYMDETTKKEFSSPTHLIAFQALKGFLDSVGLNEQELNGVGHRVVHGGEYFKASAIVTDEVLAAIRDNISLAPLHNPANLLAIEEAQKAWPTLSQVAVFDTSFHQSMPPKAYRYAIPDELYQEDGVRKYGFHGTSHRFVAKKAAEFLGKDLSSLNMVTAHLGNGCSACAIAGGLSVDTTMGLTPLEGLVMGTRSGDLDPGILHFLTTQKGMTAEEVNALLNKKSGLLGLSQLSQDMRELISARADGNELAAIAIDVFTYRLAKSIAGLCVPLNRIDVLIFTGGIGENSDIIRKETVKQLRVLGFELDEKANEQRGLDVFNINQGPGPQILVVRTDEELLIAQDTLDLV